MTTKRKSIFGSELIIIILLLVGFSSVSTAESWVEYSRNKISISYFDKDSIRKTGNVTSYKFLINDRHAFTPTLSTIFHYELICRTNEMRAIKIINTTAHFGSGSIVGVLDPAAFRPEGNTFTTNYGSELIGLNKLICKISNG